MKTMNAYSTLYALCDPVSGEIRYIGKTSAETRAKIGEAVKGNQYSGGTGGAHRTAQFVERMESRLNEVNNLSVRMRNPLVFLPPVGGNGRIRIRGDSTGRKQTTEEIARRVASAKITREKKKQAAKSLDVRKDD